MTTSSVEGRQMDGEVEHVRLGLIEKVNKLQCSYMLIVVSKIPHKVGILVSFLST
jgi:hypothetical protein